MKSKKSFLERKIKPKKFDAFNVINLMLFVGVVVMFIISLGFCIKDLTLSTNKNEYIIPILQRVLAILIAFVPLLLKKIFKIAFPKMATSIFYLFLFLSIYLGTFLNLYQKVESWDIIIHFLFGLIAGFFAMFLINELIKNKEKLSVFLVFIFVFCFSISLGVCWELYEFAFDSLLNLNMQNYQYANGISLVGQNALLDTMLDLSFDFFGAVVSALVCSVCSYKNKKFIFNFKILKLKKQSNNTISQIEE